MRWKIEYQYGAWIATDPFGFTIWALSENELKTALDSFALALS